MYGCFKEHKDNYPTRPIISAVDCVGKPLADWMLRMLDFIASRVCVHQVRSGEDLFEKISNVRMNDRDHVLITWDFDSMFTNIPLVKTKEIIRKYYHLIQGPAYFYGS